MKDTELQDEEAENPSESEEIILGYIDEIRKGVSSLQDDVLKVEEKIDEIATIEGETGPQGAPGRDGIDGVDGKDGKNGRDGRDGKDSIVPGPKGRDGKDGKNGESVGVQDVVKELQPLILSRLPHGGNMNRKETFAGVDRLTRYTDINWKPGTNVTFTIANNDQTKMVDVTISATGGGGGGLTRSIQSISASQPADSAAATDYVYLCSGTITLTMPDATAGNTNLYTIKNVGTGVVTIATTGVQTIDGSLTASLPVRYTSVDLESDTANWNVT